MDKALHIQFQWKVLNGCHKVKLHKVQTMMHPAMYIDMNWMRLTYRIKYIGSEFDSSMVEEWANIYKHMLKYASTILEYVTQS